MAVVRVQRPSELSIASHLDVDPFRQRESHEIELWMVQCQRLSSARRDDRGRRPWRRRRATYRLLYTVCHLADSRDVARDARSALRSQFALLLRCSPLHIV